MSQPPPTDDRRAFPRFSPDPSVPVLFSHPDVEVPTAGLMDDVSEGGMRIIAPPTARTGLLWADPVRIVISYSESTRRAGIEGMVLRAQVVRMTADAAGLVIQTRFDRNGHDGDWNAFRRWLAELASTGRPR